MNEYKISPIIIVATALIVLGSLLFVITMSACKWDFTALSTQKQTNTHNINQAFSNIEFDTDTTKITFVLTEDEACRVVCEDSKKLSHTVAVENQTLKVTSKTTKTFPSFFSFNHSVEVYLPKADYDELTITSKTGDILIPAGLSFKGVSITLTTGDVEFLASATDYVQIKTSTGDIEIVGTNTALLNAELSTSTGDVSIQNVACENTVAITTSTGRQTLENVTCKTLVSTGTTGSVNLKNVIATESFNITRDTGNVKFDGCDAQNVLVKTTTGDVKGTFLSEKIFFTKTTTGKVEVPKLTTGGVCDVTTTTGDIILSIAE